MNSTNIPYSKASETNFIPYDELAFHNKNYKRQQFKTLYHENELNNQLFSVKEFKHNIKSQINKYRKTISKFTESTISSLNIQSQLEIKRLKDINRNTEQSSYIVNYKFNSNFVKIVKEQVQLLIQNLNLNFENESKDFNQIKCNYKNDICKMFDYFKDQEIIIEELSDEIKLLKNDKDFKAIIFNKLHDKDIKLRCLIKENNILNKVKEKYKNDICTAFKMIKDKEDEIESLKKDIRLFNKVKENYINDLSIISGKLFERMVEIESSKNQISHIKINYNNDILVVFNLLNEKDVEIEALKRNIYSSNQVIEPTNHDQESLDQENISIINFKHETNTNDYAKIINNLNDKINYQINKIQSLEYNLEKLNQRENIDEEDIVISQTLYINYLEQVKMNLELSIQSSQKYYENVIAKLRIERDDISNNYTKIFNEYTNLYDIYNQLLSNYQSINLQA